MRQRGQREEVPVTADREEVKQFEVADFLEMVSQQRAKVILCLVSLPHPGFRELNRLHSKNQCTKKAFSLLLVCDCEE